MDKFSKTLERKIKRMHYIEGLPSAKIAEELEIPESGIKKFIREDKIKNFSDYKLEAVAKSDDYNALSLIDTFFQSAAHSSKEISMTAILGQIIREEVAEILSEEGINGLTSEKNTKLVELWFKNTEKLVKLTSNMPKMLDSYIGLYDKVLDVQRQVSYVRAMTDAIEKVAPEIRNAIRRELQRDTAAKAVLDALEPTDIASYWGSKTKEVMYTREEED